MVPIFEELEIRGGQSEDEHLVNEETTGRANLTK